MKIKTGETYLGLFTDEVIPITVDVIYSMGNRMLIEWKYGSTKVTDTPEEFKNRVESAELLKDRVFVSEVEI